MGPSGTGKTLLTREVCNEHPSGVLYCEIFELSNSAQELVMASGLPLVPAGVIDLLLGKLIDRYVDYHKLPEDPLAANSLMCSISGETSRDL